MSPIPSREDEALLALLDGLKALGYRFATVTPKTHGSFLRRNAAEARDLRGIFGWSMKFDHALLPASLWEAIRESGMAACENGLWRSRVRVSSVGEQLFLHSAFPTDDPDSVFLGPDSYRFAAFLTREIPRLGYVRHLVDLGAGAGVGALIAGPLIPEARLTMTDVNPFALRLARINARHARLEADTIEAEGLKGVAGAIDLVIANPPFVVDAAERTYRHGGSMHGASLSLEWTLEAARRIDPGGSVLLYTGSAIVAGRDALREALEQRLPALDCSLSYCEIDPDIFGELLDEPAYADVERLAAVRAVIRKTG